MSKTSGKRPAKSGRQSCDTFAGRLVVLVRTVAYFFRTHTKIFALTKTVCITAIALMLSTMLVSPFTATTSVIASAPEQKDFRFSDIFAQVAESRPVRQLDPDIIILDIGNSNRSEIAQALFELSLCSPKAVAVDILFAEPHDDDSDLLNAITSIPGIIMAYSLAEDSIIDGKMTFRPGETSFFMDSLISSDVIYAATNLPTDGSSDRGRVRDYVLSFPGSDGITRSSFVGAIAAAAFPEALIGCKNQGVVSYPSHEFTTITSDHIIDNAAAFEDKVVIVGSLSDAYDMHATPINSYFAGVLIHAYALATIVNGTELQEAPGYVDYLIATFVCFFIVLLCMTMKHLARGLLIRVLQITLLYIIMRVGYTMYVDRGIICDFTNTTLMIAFGLFAVDLWNGIVAIAISIWNKFTHLYTSKLTKQ